MRVEYANTRSDLISFGVYDSLRNWVILAALVVPVLLFVRAGTRNLEGPLSVPRVGTYVVLTSIALAAALLLIVLAVALTSLARGSQAVLTSHKISIHQRGITEETAHTRTEHEWSGVHRIARTRRHTFIYVGPHLAHVVPHRAFASSEDLESFHAALNARGART